MKKLDGTFLVNLFNKIKEQNPNSSLDELLYAAFNEVKENEKDSFEDFRNQILSANKIDEYAFYTKGVNPELKRYIESKVFPEYSKNDQGHGIVHIREVIRRSFALKSTLKLDLDDNMIYTIAACHDLGKYEEVKGGEKHAKIAGRKFISDSNMSEFFSDEQRDTIKEAIEDHSSSLEDMPRSKYGELVSSADRNTRIEIVFIRSFFVAHARMPEMQIDEYLDFTYKRLSKRYGEDEDKENMFLEDETYKVFLQDMRNLLQDEVAFKDKYCAVNHISSRMNRVCDEKGAVEYVKDDGEER